MSDKKVIEKDGGLVIVETEPTDAEFAASIKTGVIEALKPVHYLIEQALQRKMQVNFNLAIDSFGRSVVQNINVVKVLT